MPKKSLLVSKAVSTRLKKLKIDMVQAKPFLLSLLDPDTGKVTQRILKSSDQEKSLLRKLLIEINRGHIDVRASRFETLPQHLKEALAAFGKTSPSGKSTAPSGRKKILNFLLSFVGFYNVLLGELFRTQ